MVENRFTAEGQNLHQRVHADESESRKEVRIARGLRLRSLRLGLIGRADVVEFHRIYNSAADCGQPSYRANPIPPVGVELALPDLRKKLGIEISKKKGLWKPFPVEYKRGKPKVEHCDTLQLCGQALCLEEMLDVRISDGALFYGQPQRRLRWPFPMNCEPKPSGLHRECMSYFVRGRCPREGLIRNVRAAPLPICAFQK